MQRLHLIAGIALTCMLLPSLGATQSARSCVDYAWGEFRKEVEQDAGSRPIKGDDYLTAHGWVRTVQTCLAFTSYPTDIQSEVQTFKERVNTTADKIDRAIRTNSSAGLFGLSSGAGTIYLYPKTPPKAGRPLASSGQVSGQNAGSETYRMLSQREWMRVQARLTRKGFDTGGVDGVVGARTYSAIRRYQRSLGLSATGVLNSRQLAALLN